MIFAASGASPQIFLALSIIALKPSIEGETTTLYIKKILEDKGIKISRLSSGIPMGVDIDYLDEITLLNALNDRKDIS